ncbi:hypothetical protein FQN50_009982, partial [Emmonsiellopsis sp. PD_5]
ERSENSVQGSEVGQAKRQKETSESKQNGGDYLEEGDQKGQQCKGITEASNQSYEYYWMGMGLGQEQGETEDFEKVEI